MRILHVSADYPDPLQPAKTRAVSNLLEMAEGHDHRVISVNRTGWRTGIHALDFADAAGQAHRAVAYGAPPKGLFLARYLARLAEWIADDCRAADFAPDLVHAHKLTTDGLVGESLARSFGVPLALSIQGNTDLKIARAKKDLRPRYARIWKEAAVAFPFAPWTRDDLDGLLGTRTGPTHVLPCPGPADTLASPVMSSSPVIRTAFHLRDTQNKNAARLISAVGQVAREIPDLRLEILGGGDPDAFARLSAHGAQVAPGRIQFLGSVPNTEVQGLFNAATCFALVSRRESYGMVFAEALLAGAPCLIPRGRAIDGYFEDGSVVVTAHPDSEDQMVDGLRRLIREEDAFKERLSALGASGGLDILRRASIKKTYLDAIDRISQED